MEIWTYEKYWNEVILAYVDQPDEHDRLAHRMLSMGPLRAAELTVMDAEEAWAKRYGQEPLVWEVYNPGAVYQIAALLVQGAQ